MNAPWLGDDWQNQGHDPATAGCPSTLDGAALSAPLPSHAFKGSKRGISFGKGLFLRHWSLSICNWPKPRNCALAFHKFRPLFTLLKTQTRSTLARLMMNQSAYAVGQAVFLRTDTVDFIEETIAFSTLEEMVKVCSEPRENRILDKVIVYAMQGQEPCALTLGFVSASKGQRMGDPENCPTS